MEVERERKLKRLSYAGKQRQAGTAAGVTVGNQFEAIADQVSEKFSFAKMAIGGHFVVLNCNLFAALQNRRRGGHDNLALTAVNVHFH